MASGDPSSVLTPVALNEAERLIEVLEEKGFNDQIMNARTMLAWFFWFRYLLWDPTGEPEGPGREESRSIAFEMFVYCFVADVGPWPEELLPELAERCVPSAFAALQYMRHSESPTEQSVAYVANMWRRILAATPLKNHDRPKYQLNLGVALQALSEINEDPAIVTEAIENFEAAAAGTSSPSETAAESQTRLSTVFYYRFQRSGLPSDLDAVIGAAQAAVEARSADDPELAANLSNLGLSFWMRHESTGSLSDLDSAIDAFQRAVHADNGEEGIYSVRMSSLLKALHTRFERLDLSTDLDKEIDALKAVSQSEAIANTERIEYLSRLGGLLRIRFSRSQYFSDLEAAIGAYRATIDAMGTSHPDRPSQLGNLGLALHDLFKYSKSLPDLNAVIDAYSEAVTAAVADDPNYAALLSVLASMLNERFEYTGQVNDIETAINVAERALSAAPPGHAHRLICLNNYGAAALTRHRFRGAVEDLDHAISSYQAAVTEISDDAADRGDYLAAYGNALSIRFQQEGRQEDLNTAIKFLEAADIAEHSSNFDRAMGLAYLGSAMLNRFEHAGVIADLDEAIKQNQRAAELAKDGLQRSMILGNLGACLTARFSNIGVPTDLDDAIRLYYAATEAKIPASHPNGSALLNGLSVALQMRFERDGELADIDMAAGRLREAVESISPNSPERAKHLNNLSVILQTRFKRTGEITDLDRAIETGRAAANSHSGLDDRVRSLSNLGISLRLRYEQQGSIGDLDDAIETCSTAIRIVSPNHPLRVACLLSLGNALWSRAARNMTLTDLDAAIEAFDDALKTASPAGRDRVISRTSLGHAFELRYKLSGLEKDRQSAASNLVAVADMDTAPPSIRIESARSAGLLYSQAEPGLAASLLQQAVLLLPVVAPRQLARSDQQYAIARFAGLASEAAAYVLADTNRGPDRAGQALRLLEAGRTLLLSQAIDTRSDLTDLRQQHPELAKRFVQLRDELDQSSEQVLAANNESFKNLGVRSSTRRHLTTEFNDTLGEIRALEGFQAFGLPPDEDELLAIASSGPVVALNTSQSRVDALLLTRSGITSVELPRLNEDVLITHANDFNRALNVLANSINPAERNESQDKVRTILEWLWDEVAEPVLHALGYRSGPQDGEEWPRLWWMPSGIFALLPLHAAGYHYDSLTGCSNRTVMDRVISSYTPSIRALQYARQRATQPIAANNTLIVAMPVTPGITGSLQNVPEEVAMLRSQLPNPVVLMEPTSSDASPDGTMMDIPTKMNVLKNIPMATIAHFACHGYTDLRDPSNSRLLLHDHMSDPLTVSNLSSVKLESGRLAYLSACRTAITSDHRLIDEAIHLSSAFQLAGFPHVIATLWEIGDAIALRVARNFYEALRGGNGIIDTGRAAHALHYAIHATRAERLATPSVWAAFLHAGA